MKREEYNKSIVKRCVELLQSNVVGELLEGVILSAYLIEQAFKSELRKINPLLYFEKKKISDESEVRIVMGTLSGDELGRLKTSNAKRCIAQMCEYKKDIAPHKAKIEELFEIRNFILHSVEDIIVNEGSVAETAISSLRATKKYVIEHSGISATDLNPLTSAEFKKLQEQKYNEKVGGLKSRIEEHGKVFKKLDNEKVSHRLRTNLPKLDDYTWIEKTLDCPACGQASFDEICAVDFDWNPDGVLTTGGCHYQCRVCELKLSEYEYELVAVL